jgi:hypothetical protein
VRDALRRFRVEQISIHAATAELGLGRSRFYELYGSYLAACARRRARSWTPIFSRGNQRQPFPDPVAATLRKLLGSVPPCSCSFAASEMLRRHDLALHRAAVRRWALRRASGSLCRLAFLLLYQSTRGSDPARQRPAFLRSLLALCADSPGQRQDRAFSRLLAKTPPPVLLRRANHHVARGQRPARKTAPSSQLKRGPSRIALRPTLPLVALRLEPALLSQGRPGSTHSHRLSTLSYPAPLRHLGHPQSPSKRRCLCPPTPSVPLQTPDPPPPPLPPKTTVRV